MGVQTPVAEPSAPSGLARAWTCNCGTCPFYGNACSGCNADCVACLCQRGSCDNCALRCSSRRDLPSWMRAIGDTVAFDLVVGRSGVWSALPRLIWMGDDGRRSAFPPQPWWATRIKDSITARGGARTPQLDEREPDSRALWVGWGLDKFVERWWSRRRDWASEATYHYAAALAPNFSVYGNHPRMEHLLNMRRSLLAASLLEDAGIPSIPNIYWFRLEDLDRWIEWLWEARPLAAAHNLATFAQLPDWKPHLYGLRYLAENSPPDTRWVFAGTRARPRLAALNDLFGDRYVLVSAAPVMFGRLRRILTADGRAVHADVPPAEAAALVADRIIGWMTEGS